MSVAQTTGEGLAQRLVSGWQQWWVGLSTPQKRLPLLLILLYWVILIALGGLTTDHLGTGIIILALSYGGPKARILLRFLLPLLLTAIVYDSMRFYADYLRGEVHVAEPYFFDKYLFGIHTENGLLTPNEWWELHTHPAIDLFTGFFYIFFVPIYVLFAAYWTFWKTRTGTLKYTPDQMKALTPRVMWGFFWVNMVGYTTYYWYPAAPPWYVKLHGLGPAKMDVMANAAGCARFDEILGTSFFAQWYGRSADVFGAIPSLHVSYPFMAVYYAFKFKSARLATSIYCGAVSFAAVYLNHHYVIDVILGWLYGLLIAASVDYILDRKHLWHPYLAKKLRPAQHAAS